MRKAKELIEVPSFNQASELTKRYDAIKKSDLQQGITYDKQSKIVNLFTKKWFTACSSEYVVVDFETTGLDKVFDKIIEVAAIRFVDGKEKEKFVTLVNPEIHIYEEITKITHISDKMVRNAPTEKTVIPQLINFLGDSLLAGHNVNFDVGFLEIAAQRCGYNVSYNYIDTLSISKKLFPNLLNYKLSTVAQSLKLDRHQFHRAEADAYVCSDIIDIALNTLSSDFDAAIKTIKNNGAQYKAANEVRKQARIEEFDKNRIAALVRDGKRRKEMGAPFIRISKHGTSCELCKQFESKVLIDDVYSGGKQSDGDYMLLSQAMKCGLFHSGCRHGCATFFPDIENDLNKMGMNYTKSQIKVNDYGIFIRCPECGKATKNGNFCSECGADLRKTEQAHQKAERPVNKTVSVASPQKKPKKKKAKKGCLIAVLAVLALIILMIVSGIITFE